jgi:hypothetical protein
MSQPSSSPDQIRAAVAQSGVPAPTPGDTLMDQALLVYWTSDEFPTQEIFDHDGRLLGTVVGAGRSWFRYGKVDVFDTRGVRLLGVQQRLRPRGLRFYVDGSVSAELRVGLRNRKMEILVDGEPAGEMRGSGLKGLQSSQLGLYDASGRQQGLVQRIGATRVLRDPRYSFLMSVSPHLLEPLRVALIAVPIAAGVLHHSAHDDGGIFAGH